MDLKNESSFERKKGESSKDLKLYFKWAAPYNDTYTCLYSCGSNFVLSSAWIDRFFDDSESIICFGPFVYKELFTNVDQGLCKWERSISITTGWDWKVKRTQSFASLWAMHFNFYNYLLFHRGKTGHIFWAIIMEFTVFFQTVSVCCTSIVSSSSQRKKYLRHLGFVTFCDHTAISSILLGLYVIDQQKL